MLKIKKSIILLSLPNSGTDWLTSCICTDSTIKYYREFFNPVTNPIFEQELKKSFGCELTETIPLIAIPANEFAKDVYLKTWMKKDYNFTKENYSAFKIDFFNKLFRCFILIRSVQLSLPGSRPEVANWYNAIFTSIAQNLPMIPNIIYDASKWSILHANSSEKRQIAAHLICTKLMKQKAIDLKIPVIEFSHLIEKSQEEIYEIFKNLKFVEPQQITDSIIKSRKSINNKRFDKFDEETKEFSAILTEMLWKN